jgi:NADH-quinone oxidoreductase subunit G
MKEVAKDDVLGFVDRGSFSTIACHPDRILDSNYSLNTVDICPVGALTSTDFRFKMRVWFLKETRTIDVNDGLGCNITVGARENKIHRITPRENNDVNGVWIPDSHRLNFKYLTDPQRITEPQVKGQAVDWRSAIAIAADLIRSIPSDSAAVIASARMTNEELYLCKALIEVLGAHDRHDVVPRIGEPDGILIPADRNPNTTGSRLLGVSSSIPGSRLESIAAGVRSGKIRLLICFEDATLLGLTEAELSRCTVIALGILPDTTTRQAAVLLPGSGSFEKRGSMVNIHNRLQRLNRAVQAPGQCRDDWEIIRDLAAALGSSQKAATLEEVFAQMASENPTFAGLNLGKIGDLGLLLEGVSAEPVTATLS